MEPEIPNKFAAYPAQAQRQLENVRRLIFFIAEENDLSPIEETLKWGEASYLVKGGSTIRIDWKPEDPDVIKVYFHCQTRLVETFREIYPDEFDFEGKRAIMIPLCAHVENGPPEASKQMIVVSNVTLADNLQQLVDEINRASWDDANDIAQHDVPALSAYLERQDAVFVVCHDIAETGRTLLGMASAMLALKPYGHERWLYIDEVDVCSDQRRRGAGTAIMRKLIELAEQAGCEETWLGTKEDNLAANALYRSLNPDDVETFVGYTFAKPDFGVS